MPISDAFKQEAFAQQSGDVAIALLTLTHPATSEVARISNDPTRRLGEDPLRYGTFSRGEVYEYLPVRPVLPDSQETAPPAARVAIDNIDRALVSLIRSHAEPATLLIEIVMASTPDVVERRYPRMQVTHVEYNGQEATFSLAYQALQAESFPAYNFVPSSFPGLFP